MTWFEVVWFTLASVLVTIVQGQSCISDFREIYDQEAQVNDTGVARHYVLCPNQIFVVGKLDFNNHVRLGSGVEGDPAINPPLPLRPNMTIRCGDDGSLANMCWIVDGDLQLDGTAMRNITDPSLDNILIEGLTFMSSSKHSLLATKPGAITFQDCEWKVRILLGERLCGRTICSAECL
jgi:hypothetical protein